MKHLFIFSVLVLLIHFSGLTQTNKGNRNISHISTAKKQPSKIEISYLDSLKFLKDTVTYLQIIGLRKLDYYSGTIYFAGTYYENVATLRLNEKNDSLFNKYFDRCAPGSKISFENVTWKNKSGVFFGPLTKLFILK